MSALARGALVLSLAGGLATGAGIADAEAPCAAVGRFEPAEAMVGQQVLYRLEIASTEAVDGLAWRSPPTFPGFRSERLAGRPRPSRVDPDGTRWRVREEQRALFAERPGERRVGAAVLLCRVGGREVEVAVAPAALRVVPAPQGAGGVVGPLAVLTRVAPDRATLGESVSLEVILRGGGNLWDLPDPLEGFAPPDTEVFRRRPELRLEPGTRLLVRRTFHYDLVPHTAGHLRIPALEVPYVDPDTQRIQVARTEPVQVAVAARGPGQATPGPEVVAEAEPSTGTTPSGWLPPVLLVALATAGAGAGIAGRRWWRRRALRLASRAGLAAAASARASGDVDGEAAALARTLREVLALHLPGARQRPAEDLAADPALRGPVARAAQLLEDLDRARFDPRAKPPDAAEVKTAIRRLG